MLRTELQKAAWKAFRSKEFDDDYPFTVQRLFDITREHAKVDKDVHCTKDTSSTSQAAGTE